MGKVTVLIIISLAVGLFRTFGFGILAIHTFELDQWPLKERVVDGLRFTAGFFVLGCYILLNHAGAL